MMVNSCMENLDVHLNAQFLHCNNRRKMISILPSLFQNQLIQLYTKIWQAHPVPKPMQLIR